MTAKMLRTHILKDGNLLSLSLVALITVTVFINPEIWVHDYPPDIQEKFGPKSDKARRQTKLAAIPFFLLLIGLLVRSNLTLKRQNGGSLPFRYAFLNTYGLIAYFWLFDLVILDWLVFVTLKPGIVVLPGTEGAAGYDDYAFHLKTVLPALPLAILPSLIIAALTYGRSPKS